MMIRVLASEGYEVWEATYQDEQSYYHIFYEDCLIEHGFGDGIAEFLLERGVPITVLCECDFYKQYMLNLLIQ
jgi:hypothetical protein